MQNDSDYIVVVETNVNLLRDRVKSLMINGYHPSGSLVITHEPAKAGSSLPQGTVMTYYHQPMMK